MAVINVDDIYTLDNTGKQVDDAVDYALANSNRNLLDNPWFTVNQRQITTPSSPISGYPADRWYGTYSAVTSDGVTIPAQNSSDLLQRLEPSLCAALVGKTVTVSTLEQDGTIASFTCVFPAYGSGEGSNYNMGNGIGCFVQNVSGYQRIRFRISDARTTPFALRAAKLELGSYSTLANDVPPDYKTELDKCQYYYRELKAIAATYLAQGVSVAGTNFRVILPYTMRTRPTVTYSGTLTAYYSGGNAPVTAISVAGTISDAVQLSFTTSGISGANQPVLLDAAAGAKICLSADL